MTALQGFVKIEDNANGSKTITGIVSSHPIFVARGQAHNQIVMNNDRPSGEWYCMQSPSIVGELSYVRLWNGVLTYIDQAIQAGELEAAIVAIE